MAKEIIIEINTDNNEISMEAEGFRGKGCQQALQEIEKLLGTRTTDRKAKPELIERITTQRVRR